MTDEWKDGPAVEDGGDDRLLARERLERYRVPGAPEGFAARVAAAVAAGAAGEAVAAADGSDSRQAPVSRSSRGRRRSMAVMVAGAAVLVAAAAALVLSARGGGPGGQARSGRAVAEAARRSVDVGGRAVGVLEPGARVAWRVEPSGRAEVRQTAGDVFYRVEPGGPFAVATLAGRVTVTGTCFRVEVDDMKGMNKDRWKGAAVGAAIATAVLVTVYEGSVTLASPDGTASVAPGQTALARAGAPPQVLDGAGEAAAPSQAQARAQLVQARARIATLETELAQAHQTGGGTQAHPAGDQDDGMGPLPAGPEDPNRYTDPSPDTLKDMAKNCQIAFDQPPLTTEDDPVLVDAALAKKNGVTAADRAAINRAYQAVHDRAIAELRQLYIEVTGDRDGADHLSADALRTEIVKKSPPADTTAALRRISRERAGLIPPVPAAELSQRPPVEQLYRLDLDLGREAEQAAAGVVGADVAHALRTTQGNGWEGTQYEYGGCQPASEH